MKRLIAVATSVAVLSCITVGIGDKGQRNHNDHVGSSRSMRGEYDDFLGYGDGDYYSPKPVKGYKMVSKNGDVWEVHKYQHYGYKNSPHKSLHSQVALKGLALAPLLALLAPLATLPILTSAFTTTMATVIPTITTTAGKRRRRRDAVSLILSGATSGAPPVGAGGGDGDTRDLDAIQKYLRKVRPDGDYNDEVVATYLRCSGMLDIDNGCLERLVCQFSMTSSTLSDLEKEVASLIIYAILTNKRIETDFKGRLRKAAFLGRDTPARCSRFLCTKAISSSPFQHQRVIPPGLEVVTEHPQEDDEEDFPDVSSRLPPRQSRRFG